MKWVILIMRETILKKEYMDEKTFWHITSKLNIESIRQHGLVPRDGKRDGKNKSPEDPVPRIFFSQGLEGVLGQANNLAFLINSWIKYIEKTSIGESGKDIKKKLQDFIDRSTNGEIETKDAKNGGFIDIITFIREDVFKNGINENLTEQDLDQITYDIVKTIWENDVCLKANLKESVDYSWDDVNYNAKGTREVPMTKRNMHTFEGHTIATDIIEIITDENENPRTTWDVFKEMAMFYKKEHPEKGWLPVEEWQSGYEDENGEIVYSGEIKHREDYLSKFIKIERSEQLQNLINNGTLICGRIIQENGIIRFERVEPSQIDSVLEDERGFATASMGRAVFTIDKDGLIHNFKGVDSHLSTSELGPMDLLNARSIEYAPKTDGYKVSAVVFNDKKPEIRINGASPLEDIEIEGDINKRLAKMGIKVPIISYIREIPQGFSIKYGLPIKVDGSLDYFESDYAAQDDERKKRLGEIYGSRYSQELRENQRPESMREYLQRIGFLSSPKVKANIESLGYSMQDFIDAVDSSYSRGQRYGQAERIMGSPFRISDLETCIANGNTQQLQTIMDFSEKQNVNFTEQLAEVFGKNIATLMSNGWECENLIHRQDFSLTGEFCDDSYFDILEKQAEMKEKYKTEPYKADALMGEIRRKYTGQVMHIASCIKVVQNAMSMIGKSQEQIDSILEIFVGSFANNLDLQKIGHLFKIDEKAVEEALMREFSVGQNWIEKMARQDRKEGLIMDEAIYNSHIGNEEFYAKVSGMITERIRTRQVQKGKDGFADCIDDKTRLSNVKKAIETTRKEILREPTKSEKNLE